MDLQLQTKRHREVALDRELSGRIQKQPTQMAQLIHPWIRMQVGIHWHFLNRLMSRFWLTC